LCHADGEIDGVETVDAQQQHVPNAIEIAVGTVAVGGIGRHD
jgi:hypothetical protein